jgi:hypothetical protein
MFVVLSLPSEFWTVTTSEVAITRNALRAAFTMFKRLTDNVLHLMIYPRLGKTSTWDEKHMIGLLDRPFSSADEWLDCVIDSSRVFESDETKVVKSRAQVWLSLLCA